MWANGEPKGEEAAADKAAICAAIWAGEGGWAKGEWPLGEPVTEVNIGNGGRGRKGLW